MKETRITSISTSATSSSAELISSIATTSSAQLISQTPISAAEWVTYVNDILDTPLESIFVGTVQGNTSSAIVGADVRAGTRLPTADIASRAYPHLIEEAQPALVLVEGCLSDARAALDAYDDADMESVASRLTAVAAQCAQAHSLTRFNESFGAVVSFIRRATIAVEALEVDRERLNILVQALHRIVGEPLISLLDAASVTDALSDAGWRGEHDAVEKLLALVADGSSSEANSLEGMRPKESGIELS